MGQVILVPDLGSWLVLSKSMKINILMVVDDVRALVAIGVCAFQWLLPLKIESEHPIVSSVESNQFEDMILLNHLRFLHKIDDGLCRNVCPDIREMSKQLLDKIDAVK